MSSLLNSLFSENFEDAKRIIVTPAGMVEQPAGNVEEVLTKARLNWSVEKVPLLTPEGKESGFYATRRSDTSECFATFTNQYEIFQNAELAKLVMVLSDQFGFKFKGGGSFDGGRKVYIQLEDEPIKDFGLNRDRIEKYTTAVNSHDGKLSLNFGSTTVPISCRNTFYMAYRGMKNKVRHTETMRTKVDAAISDIKGLKLEEKSMFDTFFKFLEKPATPEIVKQAITNVFEVDANKSMADLRKELSTRAMNQVLELGASIQHEMKEKGSNIWGLFSGFTHYTTHKQSAPNRENGKLESKYFGGAQEIDKTAFAFLSELV